MEVGMWDGRVPSPKIRRAASPRSKNQKSIMKHLLKPTIAACGLLPFTCGAALIATENFDYPDGPVVGLSGGTGWNYERTDEAGAPDQAPSNWTNVFGSYQIVSSALVTNNGGVRREFGGPTEGSGAGSNEREGAFRAEGAFFFSASMNVTSMLPDGENQWAGISSYDFDAERIFFGMPGQNTETRYFGIEISNNGPNSFTTIPVVSGVTFTVVGMVDFDNDLLALWVNPDGSDDATTYDVSLEYTGTNWATGLRFASGSEVTWDDVMVGTAFADVVAVPEPSVALTALVAAGFLAGRRRR